MYRVSTFLVEKHIFETFNYTVSKFVDVRSTVPEVRLQIIMNSKRCRYHEAKASIYKDQLSVLGVSSVWSTPILNQKAHKKGKTELILVVLQGEVQYLPLIKIFHSLGEHSSRMFTAASFKQMTEVKVGLQEGVLQKTISSDSHLFRKASIKHSSVFCTVCATWCSTSPP